MFTIQTGAPGTGKTLSATSLLLALQPSKPGFIKSLILKTFNITEAVKPPREIFVHGIRDLKIPHTLFYCSAETCQFCNENRPKEGDYYRVEDWRNWAPKGSFFVFDEAQNCFRPTPPGSTVPDHIAFFETHRHHGIDGVLITQHPKLVHSNVRRLMNKHIHIVKTFAGSFKYEWSETNDGLSYATAVKTPFVHNKKVYSLYKSSEIHNKFSMRMHPAAYLVLLALPVVLYLAYRSYTTVFYTPGPIDQSVQQSITPPPVQPVTQPAVLGDTAVRRGAQDNDVTPVEHPFSEFSLYLTGVSYIGGLTRATFIGRSPLYYDTVISNQDLASAGYTVKYSGPCSVTLSYRYFKQTFGCFVPPVVVRNDDEQTT